MQWKGGHSFPGGHVEVGESCAAAAIREVYEETGLTLTHVEFCGTCEWFDHDGGQRKLGLLYRSDAFTGEIHSSAEGRISWLPLSEMTAEKSAASMLTLLKIFRREAAAAKSDEWNGDLFVDARC